MISLLVATYDLADSLSLSTAISLRRHCSVPYLCVEVNSLAGSLHIVFHI
jgi:hypothetical protein